VRTALFRIHNEGIHRPVRCGDLHMFFDHLLSPGLFSGSVALA
jgi:hypothetical protein